MASAQTTSQQNLQAYTYEPDERSWTSVNVGQVERWISALSGIGLATTALIRRDQLGLGLGLTSLPILYRAISGHSFLYQLFDITTVEQSPSTKTVLPAQQGIRVQQRMTINRSPEDLYNFWRDVEKTPQYMHRIESVLKTGERTSHWIAKGPFGRKIEWNSELLQDAPGHIIAWHVHGKPNTANAGKVTFEQDPGGHGTIVILELTYLQFKGPFGTNIGKVFGELPEHEALENLRHFKELMETGEIPTTQGQPTGKGRKEGGLL